MKPALNADQVETVERVVVVIVVVVSYMSPFPRNVTPVVAKPWYKKIIQGKSR